MVVIHYEQPYIVIGDNNESANGKDHSERTINERGEEKVG